MTPINTTASRDTMRARRRQPMPIFLVSSVIIPVAPIIVIFTTKTVKEKLSA
jgi:hypothetical protein